MISTYLESGKFGGYFTSEENIPQDYFISQVECPNNLIDGYFDTETQTWYENATNDNKIQLAIQIDLQYTNLISELMRKHIEKYAIDGIEIPTNIIEQRNALRNECNEKIIALGIVDFTYRKTVKVL